MVSRKNFLLEAETKFAGNGEALKKIRLAVRGENAQEILGRIGNESEGPLKDLTEYFASAEEADVIADLMTGTHKAEKIEDVLKEANKTDQQIKVAEDALTDMRAKAVALFEEQVKGIDAFTSMSAEHDIKKAFLEKFESQTTIPDSKAFTEWANEFKITSDTRRQLRDGVITPQEFAKKEEMAKKAKEVAGDFKRAGRHERGYSELMDQASKSVDRLAKRLEGNKLEKVEESLEAAANAAEKARDFFATKAPEFESHLPKEFDSAAALEEVTERSIEAGKKAVSEPKYTKAADSAGASVGETAKAAGEGWFVRDKSKGMWDKVSKEGKEIGNLKKGPAFAAVAAAGLLGAWALGAFKGKHPEYEAGTGRTA